MISSIIEWSEANIKLGKKRKIRPLWRTLNIKASIYCGTYESSTKVITIYLKNNPDIKTLVDTCIHEYIHHLQIRGNVDCIRYNKQTNLKGYWENDYETEARILAKKYTNQCIKDLKL